MKRQLLALTTLLFLFLAACGGLTAPTPVAPATTPSPAAEPTSSPVVSQPEESEIIPIAQVATTAAPPAAVETLEESLIDLYQQVNASVVYIIMPEGSGSGFVYGDEGYIVTNNHVVAGASRFEVVSADGERRPATLVGRDVDSDLAVLEVEDLPAGVEPLALADPNDIQVGQFVAAIGSPFGEQGSMSLGIVSGLGRSLLSQRGLQSGSTYSLPGVIQTDAPINPGNSGGPLLNLDGEVVGVNSAIASVTGTNSGVGFAIPVSALHLIIPGLIADGEYQYPYMGVGFDGEISLAEQTTYRLSQTHGAYVLSVTPGGPADDAGLVAADADSGRGGDLIVAVDDQPIASFADLNSYLVFHTTVDQTIELTLLRDGEEITLPLTLGERP